MPDLTVPTVLIVSTCPWIGRAIDAAVSSNGYATVRATDLAHAARLCRSGAADGVIVDEQLTDRVLGDRDPGFRALLDAASDAAAIPVVMLTHEPIAAHRLTAILAQGVWGVVPFPLGASSWATQFGVWVRAARGLRRRAEAGLVDAETGLYNAEGLSRRASEIDGEIRRRGGAIACAIFDLAAPASEALALTVADVCRRTGRASDTFGRIGDRDFAVVAPDADLDGVHVLVRRIAESVETRVAGAELRVGACGVADLNGATLTVPDMLSYAASRRAPLYGAPM